MSKIARALACRVDGSLLSSVTLPHYSERKGWTGGDSYTLYAYVDNRTGAVFVRPGKSSPGIGPAATVRVATRAEAERDWQKPLSPAWTIAPAL